MRRADAEHGGEPSGIRRAAGLVRAHPGAAFAAAFGILAAVLFFDPLLLPRAFAGRDLGGFFYPIEKSIHAQWRSGHVPLIVAELSWGKPLAANPNFGVFYPPRIAMALLPFSFAIKLFLVLHVWLAGVGAFRLARARGSSGAGSTLAGIVYGLGGPTLAETLYPDFLPGVALMPWVVLAAILLARRRDSRAAAVFAAVWGAALLAGDVFTAGLALFGAVLATVEEAPPRARALGRLFAASVPGFLLSGIQAIPASLLVPHTVRALGQFPLRATLSWSLSPWRLLELLVRLPFGNAARSPVVWGDVLWSGKTAGFLNTIYLGTIAGAALIARPAKGRRLLPWTLGAFSLAAAAAGSLVPERLLDAASPIPLRYPEKLTVGLALSASLLAAALVDRLREGGARRVWRGALAAAALVAAAGVAVRLSPHAAESFVLGRWTRSPERAAAAAQSLPGILARASLLWAGAAAALLAAGRRRRAAGILVLFAAFDLSLNRILFVDTAPAQDVFGPPVTAPAVARFNGGERFGYFPVGDYYRRPFDRAALLLDSAAAFGVFAVFNQDYDASDLYRVDLVRRQIYRDGGRWEGLPGLLSAFSARTAIVETGRMPAGFALPAATFGPRWLVVNPAAVPLVRLAPSVEEVLGPAEAWEAIRDARRDPAAAPVVETGGRGIRSLATGTLRVLRFDAAAIEVESTTDGGARVVLPRAWSPFRTIRVDGAPAEGAATNLALTSVAVPAGLHRIRVDERLPGGAAGPLVSAVGAAAILLLVLRRPALGARAR